MDGRRSLQQPKNRPIEAKDNSIDFLIRLEDYLILEPILFFYNNAEE